MGLLIYDLDHGDRQLCLCAQLWVILISMSHFFCLFYDGFALLWLHCSNVGVMLCLVSYFNVFFNKCSVLDNDVYGVLFKYKHTFLNLSVNWLPSWPLWVCLVWVSRMICFKEVKKQTVWMCCCRSVKDHGHVHLVYVNIVWLDSLCSGCLTRMG